MTLDSAALAARLAAHLASPDTGAAAGLARIVVRRLLATRVEEWVDPEEVGELVTRVMAAPGAEARLARHLVPAYAASAARFAADPVRLGDLVPPEVEAQLQARLDRPSGLPRGWARGIVDPALLREVVAGALAETLEGFVARLPLGGGAAGGLLGALSKGAGRIKQSGPSGGLLGGLGAEFQRKLQTQARHYARQSADLLRERVEAGLRARERREALSAMRRRALSRILDLTLADLLAVAQDPGPELLSRWLGQVLEQALGHPAVRAAVAAEVAALLTRDGASTLAELLVEVEAAEEVATLLERSLARQLADLAGDPAFVAWLEAALGAVA